MITKSITALAAQINSEHDACNRAAAQSLEHAMTAGDLLSQAKRLCPHGSWQGWLADNFRGSARTARVYQRLSKHRATIESNRQGSAVLSIDGALRLLTSTQAPLRIADPGALKSCESVVASNVDGARDVWESMASIARLTGRDLRDVYREHCPEQTDAATWDSMFGVYAAAFGDEGAAA